MEYTLWFSRRFREFGWRNRWLWNPGHPQGCSYHARSYIETAPQRLTIRLWVPIRGQQARARLGSEVRVQCDRARGWSQGAGFIRRPGAWTVPLVPFAVRCSPSADRTGARVALLRSPILRPGSPSLSQDHRHHNPSATKHPQPPTAIGLTLTTTSCHLGDYQTVSLGPLPVIYHHRPTLTCVRACA